MPESLVLLVLESVSHENASNQGQICANHIYLNSHGDIKVGYGASVAEYLGSLTQIVDGSHWPFIDPARSWVWPTPKYECRTHDVDGFKLDIWHFEITALELVYDGLRVKDEQSLLTQLDDMFEKKKFHASLVDDLGKSEIQPMKKLKHSFLGNAMGVVMKVVGQSLGVNPIPGVLSITPSERSVPMSHAFQEMVIECINPNPLGRPSIEDLLERPVFKVHSHVTGKDLIWKH
ncbi:hypothetical protein C2S52_014230 [Perilla frutescens var. hirtella]|nr:hypothetical protein C2S52_014230 [Perilla frutescens var. hirtella]